jgi:ribosomal-protein-alanine N-acetyltransferase
MIRRFTLSDLNRILEIEHRAFPKSPYTLATFLDLYRYYPETFLVYVARPHGREQGHVVGYIVFTQEGHIIYIAVDPEWRRTGIGRRLIERVARHPRVKKVWAEVRISNQGAQTFYQRIGFQVVGRITNYYGDEDALLVEKSPSPPSPFEGNVR